MASRSTAMNSYQGYWPGHIEGLEFDADICRAELAEDAENIGIELSEEDLDEMVQREAQFW